MNLAWQAIRSRPKRNTAETTNCKRSDDSQPNDSGMAAVVVVVVVADGDDVAAAAAEDAVVDSFEHDLVFDDDYEDTADVACSCMVVVDCWTTTTELHKDYVDEPSATDRQS